MPFSFQNEVKPYLGPSVYHWWGGGHRHRQCWEKENGESTPKCYNFEMKHPSRYRGCSYVRKEPVHMKQHFFPQAHIASIFRVEKSASESAAFLTLVPHSRIFLPWRWRRYVPPTCRFTQDLHGATSQKTTFFIATAVKTSNLTYLRCDSYNNVFLDNKQCHDWPKSQCFINVICF
jgi:hypothetical protein